MFKPLRKLLHALPVLGAANGATLRVTPEELAQARRAHREWHMNLVACLTGHSNEVLHPEELCFDDRCVFGQWLQTTGEARLGHEGFAALNRHHKMVHLHAANVVSFRLAGQLVKARTLFKTGYADSSRALMTTIDELEAQCASRPMLMRRRVRQSEAPATT